MESIKRYYEDHVKGWVKVAKKLYQARLEGKDIAKLVKESKSEEFEFKLKDVHRVDLELIVEYFRKLDVMEREHVWENSPAKPVYKAAVVNQAFVDSYNRAREKDSYVEKHYDGEKEAKEEIHKIVEISKKFYEKLWIGGSVYKGIEYSDPKENKEEFGRLVSGIYNNEILIQIKASETKRLIEDYPQFKEDLDFISEKGKAIITQFATSPYIAGDISIDSLFKRAGDKEYKSDEDHIANNYKDKPLQRRILEGLLVELHMMKTAVKDYVEWYDRVHNRGSRKPFKVVDPSSL